MRRQSNTLGHIHALDGLRAAAVLTVVLGHSYEAFNGGIIGVVVFFVLSGFVVTRALAVELTTSGTINFGRFMLRRAARLIPAFFAMAAVWFVATVIVTGAIDGPARTLLVSATYLMNWNRAYLWVADRELGHTWSLAIEEQFYVLWPVLLLWLGRRHVVSWLWAVIAAVIAWRFVLAGAGSMPGRLANGFDTRCDALFLGCILALRPPAPSVRAACAKLSPLLLAAMFAYTVFGRDELSIILYGFPIMTAAAAMLVVGLTVPNAASALLSLGPIRYLGRISYGIYLWHYPINAFAMNNWHHFYREEIWMALLSIAVAAISHEFLERPIIAWTKARTDGRGVRQDDAKADPELQFAG